MRFWILGAACLALGGTAMARDPAFDPRAWKAKVAGKTPVLVIGSVHLKNLGSFQPAWMDGVLSRLVAYRPQIVTVEALSGPQCDVLRRYPATYPGVAANYCPSVQAARDATGMDVPQATAAADAILAGWADRPTAAARRRLASVFLAGGEPASALVQWLRLPDEERHDGDGLDDKLVKQLNDLRTNPNENYQVGAVVAARAGLERVYAVDDHTADGAASEDPAFGVTLKRLWAEPSPTLAKVKAQPFASPQDMLASYRLLNQPTIQIGSVADDFGRALADTAPGDWGRQYVSWWEVRNLRMVGNIRATFAKQPRARVLVIVGSAHKPYFDAYLDQMHEVEVQDAVTALR